MTFLDVGIDAKGRVTFPGWGDSHKIDPTTARLFLLLQEHIAKEAVGEDIPPAGGRSTKTKAKAQ